MNVKLFTVLISYLLNLLSNSGIDERGMLAKILIFEETRDLIGTEIGYHSTF